MGIRVRALIKRAVNIAGFHISRVPPNRFDAMEVGLRSIARFGYRPRVIVDAGASFGHWAATARRIFPGAALHLIEPQPACASALEHLAAESRDVVVHNLAVTEPGVSRLRIVGAGADGGSSGAGVVRVDDSFAGDDLCNATTLDRLLADRVRPDDRALLKLDLEGHELSALSGASRLLPALEVIVTEVQFYDIEHESKPCFTDLARWLMERGFQLYDVLALASRPRDGRLRSGDAMFVRGNSPLLADVSWA